MPEEKNGKFSRKGFWKILKKVSLFLAILIFLVEVSLRLFYHEQLKIRAYPLIYLPSKTFGYIYMPRSEGYLCRPSIEKQVRLNNMGFPGPDFDLIKPPHVFRIAIVGGSIASGIWMQGDSTFSDHLQANFNQNYSGVEVMNFSIDGKFRDITKVVLTHRMVLQYQPDLILLSVSIPFVQSNHQRKVYKDYVIEYGFGESPTPNEQIVDEIESKWSHKALYRISFIYRAYVRWYSHRYNDDQAYWFKAWITKYVSCRFCLQKQYSERDTGLLLQNLSGMLASSNCQLQLLFYQPNQQLEEFCLQNGLRHIFLNIPRNQEFLHEYDGHYNAWAHKEIGMQLYEKLMSSVLSGGDLR